jgi:4-amino-4-deoxychorismate lyase
MAQLLETIHILNGQPQNLSYHNHRCNQSRKFFWGRHAAINLAQHINVPEQYQKGHVRCRVLYQAKIEEIQYLPYQYKPIKTLQIVESDIKYYFKWADRQAIDQLYQQKGAADDILIVKDDQITDTSYTNIIFRGEYGLFTPKNSLTCGTKRHKLLDEGKIFPLEITLKMLQNYSHFCLVNAFMELDEARFLPIENILY